MFLYMYWWPGKALFWKYTCRITKETHCIWYWLLKDAQDVLRTSYVRSIYALRLGGNYLLILDNLDLLLCFLGSAIQKKSSICVLLKRCPENMQPNYRRTPMPKCNFNKVEKLLLSDLQRPWMHLFQSIVLSNFNYNFTYSILFIILFSVILQKVSSLLFTLVENDLKMFCYIQWRHTNGVTLWLKKQPSFWKWFSWKTWKHSLKVTVKEFSC